MNSTIQQPFMAQLLQISTAFHLHHNGKITHQHGVSFPVIYFFLCLGETCMAMFCVTLYTTMLLLIVLWPGWPLLTFLNYISEAFEIHLTKFDFVLPRRYFSMKPQQLGKASLPFNLLQEPHWKDKGPQRGLLYPYASWHWIFTRIQGMHLDL